MRRVLNLMLSKGAGGLEAVAFQYARVLAGAGCDSAMVVNSQSPYEAADGVSVFRTPGASLANPFNHLAVIRSIRRFRPDVVFCHGSRGAQFCTWLLRLLAPRGTCFVGVCHGSNGWRFRRFGRVIAVSEGVRRELVETWGLAETAVTVCPNAIALPQAEDCSVRPHEVPTIGFLGRLDRCKGVDLLLEALASLKAKGLRFRLVVGGTGPEEAELKARSEREGQAEDIRWLGWVSDKQSFFSQVDAVVLPSREEGLPVALLEAMSFARAVVVSDCPGMKGVVEGASCGLVVPRGDAVALAGALERLLGNDAERERFASAGRAAIAERHSEGRLRDDLLDNIVN